MARCAYLLGHLAAKGIMHTDIIALFHYSYGAGREDNGTYFWWKGGDLEKWLYYTRYPNIGLTGLRDLAHLISWRNDKHPVGYEGQKGLYRMMGTQLLSLFLVTGSYFRNQAPERVGFTESGEVTDARDLFDKKILQEAIQEILRNYYLGFTGKNFTHRPAVDLEKLSRRMIEEMGVDNHMYEILYGRSQLRMSDVEFRDFLVDRGVPRDYTQSMERSDRRIFMPTGPHLGEFSGRFPISDMLETIAIMAGLCITGKFFNRRR
jgi:hypothetical protein